MPFRLIRLVAAASLTLVSLLPSAAFAQGRLADLAPPDTLLAIGFSSGEGGWERLREDLLAIDWSGLRETLASVLMAADSGMTGSPLGEFDGSFAGDELTELLEEACPTLGVALAAVHEEIDPAGLEGLLTLGGESMPTSVTALVDLSGASEVTLESLELALTGCATEVSPADSGGELLRFDSDAGPILLRLTSSGLLVMGTDSGDVKEVLARESGEDLPSLADAPIFSAFPAVDDSASFLSLALLVEPFMASIEALLPLLPPLEPSQQGLADRALAAIDSVDAVAARISSDESGLTTESALQLDPDEPDPELARLFTCEGCGLIEPRLAPAGAVSFSSFHFPVAKAIDYLEGWLTAAGTSLSEVLPAELQDLSFLSEQAYYVVLEPVSTDLRSLVYQPAQAMVIPVSSRQEAQEALDEIINELEERLSEPGPLRHGLTLSSGEYRGVPFERAQALLNLDLALAVVGDQLVVASPARALEAIVATHFGGPSLMDEDRYRQLAAELPAGAQGVTLSDSGQQLAGLANVLDLFPQPLAFLVGVLATADTDGDSDPNEDSLGESPSLEGITPTGMAEGVASGVLEDGTGDGAAADPVVDGHLSDFYLLEGFTVGDEVTVVLESDSFDTYLFLHDLSTGEIVAYNDDDPDTSRSSIEFEVAEGGKYLVQITSYFGDASGEYRLSVERSAAVEAAVLPSYGELLELFGLPSRVLTILADNFGLTTGYSTRDGELLYSRSHLESRP